MVFKIRKDPETPLLTVSVSISFPTFQSLAAGLVCLATRQWAYIVFNKI